MQKFIDRLIRCDYSKERAESACYDMWLNCGYVSLVLFVDQNESEFKNVG